MEEKQIGMAWYKFLRYWMFGFAIIFNLLSYLGEYAEYGPTVDTLTITIFWIIVFLEIGLKIIIHFHLKNYSRHINRQFIIYAVCCAVTYFLFYPFYAALGSMTGMLIIIIPTLIYFRKRSHIFVNECNFFGKKTGSPVQVCPDYASGQPEYKFCRKCGEKLFIDDKFCSRCGTQVIETEEE